jgi:hypothetical protein
VCQPGVSASRWVVYLPGRFASRWAVRWPGRGLGVSELEVYLRLVARRGRRAVARAGLRHVHAGRRPMVVVGYHLAGEPGAPVGLRYGTSAGAARTVVVAEPRDRDARFAALAGFARDLSEHVAGYGERDTVPRLDRRGALVAEDELCRDAPQLVVANPATAEWLCDTLGRSLRHPPAGVADRDVLVRAGEHLGFFAGRRVLPGSAVVLAATDLLTTHWTTGQLPAEDGDLSAALAWIDPPLGTDAVEASRLAADTPPAGPIPDPDWDQHTLLPTLDRAARHRPTVDVEVERVVGELLGVAWERVWRAWKLVEALSEAEHVAVRWESDRWAWTRHLGRVAEGTARFGRLDQLRSFAFLAELERRTAALERQMALDDPRLMAGYVAAGEALAGSVLERDAERFETNARGSRVRRPLLRVLPAMPFDRPAGTELWLADRPSVRVRTGDAEPDGTVPCVVVAGMGRTLPQAEAALPAAGAEVVLAPFGPQDTFPDNLPDELPWTHRPPTDTDDESDERGGDA